MAKNTESFTPREKMTMHLIFMLVRIINPTGYTHEIDKPLDELRKLIKLDD